MSTHQQKLATLQPAPITWRIAPSDKLVRAFEKQFQMKLPAGYRDFLAEHGGTWVSAQFPILEPCPCGQQSHAEAFYGFMPPEEEDDDIRFQTEIFQGAPVIAPIAECPFGSMLAIKCEGADAGVVYFFDGQGRFAWPDEQFRSMFENLHPEIVHFLDLRRQGKLPKKPPGYENFYRVAASFDEFLASCELPAEVPAAPTDSAQRWTIVDGYTELGLFTTWDKLETAIRAIAEKPDFASRPNAYVELFPHAPAKWSVHFGIAGPADGDNPGLTESLACLAHTDPDRQPAKLHLVGDPSLSADGAMVIFRLEDGTKVPVARRHCVPTPRLLEIVRAFFETGKQPEGTQWEP